jgi:phosphate-selective porin OprO and OprP
VPDFGEGRAVVQDAYTTFRPWSWLQLQIGKFKAPVGLERLQSDANAVFIERSHPTSLVPNRDVGVQLQGEVGKKIFEYALGIFNGVPDGGSGDIDNHDNKDYVARVFGHPFRALDVPAISNFGIGVGVSVGKHNGTAATPALPTFRTPGQQSFFSFLADTARPEATVVARSDRYRISPQAYYFVGPLGLMGEYALSHQTVIKGAEQAELDMAAWQVTGSVVVTGEDATFEAVAPKKPFNLETGDFGALEVAARYHELKVDSDAFPVFADHARAARLVRSWGVAVNWHITKGNRFAINYDRTNFRGGAADGADREPENALFLRAQAAF